MNWANKLKVTEDGNSKINLRGVTIEKEVIITRYNGWEFKEIIYAKYLENFPKGITFV